VKEYNPIFANFIARAAGEISPTVWVVVLSGGLVIFFSRRAIPR